MKITYLFLDLASFEISIEETNSQEECLIITFEIGKDLNHPIDHSSSEVDIDIMCIKSIRSIKFKFKFSQVFVNIRTQLIPDVDVLSLNFGGGFSWELSSWMRLAHVAAKHKIIIIHNRKFNLVLKVFTFWFILDAWNTFHKHVLSLRCSVTTSQLFGWRIVWEFSVHLFFWFALSVGHWSRLVSWRSHRWWNWTCMIKSWSRGSFAALNWCSVTDISNLCFR